MFFLFFDDRRMHMADSHSDDPVTYPFDMKYIERSFSKPVIMDGYRDNFELYDRLNKICHAACDLVLPTCMMIFEDDDAIMAKMAPENLIIDYENAKLPYFGTIGPVSLDEINDIYENDFMSYRNICVDLSNLTSFKTKVLDIMGPEFISYSSCISSNGNSDIEEFRIMASGAIDAFNRMMESTSNHISQIRTLTDTSIHKGRIVMEDIKSSIRSKMNFNFSSY